VLLCDILDEQSSCSADLLLDCLHPVSVAQAMGIGVRSSGDEFFLFRNPSPSGSRYFMTQRQRPMSAIVLLTMFASGCGSGNDATTRPIMTEGQHRHYHVHAPDAKHDHTHPKGVLGGHVHAHKHLELF
jgi:hypothetical protein